MVCLLSTCTCSDPNYVYWNGTYCGNNFRKLFIKNWFYFVLQSKYFKKPLKITTNHAPYKQLVIRVRVYNVILLSNFQIRVNVHHMNIGILLNTFVHLKKPITTLAWIAMNVWALAGYLVQIMHANVVGITIGLPLWVSVVRLKFF